jgi:hypothetical protein
MPEDLTGIPVDYPDGALDAARAWLIGEAGCT